MEKIYTFQENGSMTSKLGVLLEIFSFFTVKEQLEFQLIWQKIYRETVPLCIKYTKFRFSTDDIWHWFNWVMFQHNWSEELVKWIPYVPTNIIKFK